MATPTRLLDGYPHHDYLKYAKLKSAIGKALDDYGCRGQSRGRCVQDP